MPTQTATTDGFLPKNQKFENILYMQLKEPKIIN